MTQAVQDEYSMRFNILQPRSTFVMNATLPSSILEKMIKITDEIVENKESAMNASESLAGQIEDEFFIALDILEREELNVFFLNVCKTYAEQAFRQTYPYKSEGNKQRSDAIQSGVSTDNYLCDSFLHQSTEVWRQQLSVKMNMMWMNSQKDNEYNPLHVHTSSHISAILYLKIPEFLPSRKSHRNFDDGAVGFTHNVGNDPIWGIPTMTISPKVGEFFIFPASLQHFVYPFRTADGKGERRSVSFNASFSNKQENS